MRDYKKYDVWIKSHELVLFTYSQVLICFPASEKYDSLSQLKRATYSIALNIAEGCGRNTDKDFVHFLDISWVQHRKLNIVYYLLLIYNILIQNFISWQTVK